jgi:hypothetical protein
MDNLEDLPVNPMFQKLSTVDFFHCHEGLPPLVTGLIERSDSSKAAKRLVMKILKDTVPPRFSFWAISLVFRVVDNARKGGEVFSEQIFETFYEDMRRRSAIYLLYWAIVVESDFQLFPDGHIFSFSQRVIVDGSEISIRFHPFHTTRRIYHFVGQAIDKPWLNFSLVYADSEHRLPFNAPLTSVPFHWERPLIFKTVPADEQFVAKPIGFSSYFKVPERCAFIFQAIRDSTPESEILFELLSYFGDPQVYPRPVCPLQGIFKGDFLMWFEYTNSVRIWPRMLISAASDPSRFTDIFITHAFTVLAHDHFDEVSVAICCQSLVAIGRTFTFDRVQLKTGLFDSSREIVREAFLSLVSDTIPIDRFLTLVHLTAQPEYRTRSKQFYQMLKQRAVDPLLLEPVYFDLHPFETRGCSHTDQTVISLLSILAPTETVVTLTFDRLFGPPPCSRPTPFLYTRESRAAAFSFLLRVPHLPQLDIFVNSMPLYSGRSLLPDFESTLSCTATSSGCAAFVLHLLSCVDPFVDSLISSPHRNPVLADLSALFLTLRVGVSGPCPVPDAFASVALTPASAVRRLFSLIDREFRYSSFLPLLFQATVNDDPFGYRTA